METMKIPPGTKRRGLFSSFSLVGVCLISSLPSLLLFLSSTVFCEGRRQPLSADTRNTEDLHGRGGLQQIFSQDHSTGYSPLTSLFLSAYLSLLQHAGRAERKEENARSSVDVPSVPDGQTSPLLLHPHPEELQDAKDTDQPVDQRDLLHRPSPSPPPSRLSTESSREEEDEDSSSERAVHTPEQPQSTSGKGRRAPSLGQLADPRQRLPRPRRDPESPAHGGTLYSRHTRSKTAVSTDLRAETVKTTPVGVERTTSLSSSFSHIEYFHTSSSTTPSVLHRRESPTLRRVVGVEDARRRHSNKHLGVRTFQGSSSAEKAPAPPGGHPSSSSAAPTQHSPPSGGGGAADDDVSSVQDSRRRYRRRVNSRSRSQRFSLLEKTFTYVQQVVSILCILYGLFQLFQMGRAGTESHLLHLDVETSSSSSSLTSEETDDEKRHSDKEKADAKPNIVVEKKVIKKMPSELPPSKKGPPEKIANDLGESKRNLRRKELLRLETREVASAFIAGEQKLMARKKEEKKRKKRKEEDRIPSFTMLS